MKVRWYKSQENTIFTSNINEMYTLAVIKNTVRRQKGRIILKSRLYKGDLHCTKSHLTNLRNFFRPLYTEAHKRSTKCEEKIKE